MKETIYTTVQLSEGKEAVIVDCKGVHIFNAMSKAGSNSHMMLKYMMLELVRIDGSKIIEEHLDDMDASDIMKLMDVISSQVNFVR